MLVKYWSPWKVLLCRNLLLYYTIIFLSNKKIHKWLILCVSYSILKNQAQYDLLRASSCYNCKCSCKSIELHRTKRFFKIKLDTNFVIKRSYHSVPQLRNVQSLNQAKSIPWKVCTLCTFGITLLILGLILMLNYTLTLFCAVTATLIIIS